MFSSVRSTLGFLIALLAIICVVAKHSAQSQDGREGGELKAIILEEITVRPWDRARIDSWRKSNIQAGRDSTISLISPEAGDEHCATHLINRNIGTMHQDEFTAAKKCPAMTRCDRPEERDKFSSPSDIRFIIEWVVFDDGSDFFSNAEEHVNAAAGTLDLHYEGVGVIFEHVLVRRQLADESGKMIKPFYVGATDCKQSSLYSPCFSPLSLLQAALVDKSQGRNSWQKKQSFQILVSQFQDPALNGYAVMPYSKVGHGLVAITNRVVRAGYTTITHELGHAFGLQHTFRGISEVGCDDACREDEPSDLTGDYCSDTAPEPMHWGCEDPDVSQYPDKCSQRSSWSGTNANNFMGYSSDQFCRTTFTEQQIRRIRCYAKFVVDNWDNNRPWSAAASSWHVGSAMVVVLVMAALFTALL